MISEKFRMTEPEHVWALLHAIGQLETINQRGATVAEVARFMNVSKPTARKHLSQLVREGDLLFYTNHGFSRFGREEYRLMGWVSRAYVNGDYKSAYEKYCQVVLKVILV